jgi:hypothetical protein
VLKFPYRSKGVYLTQKALKTLFFLGLAFGLKAAEETREAPEFDEKFRRGGSFSLEPAFLLPTNPLDKVLQNSVGYNINFDVAVSRNISVTFGGAYYNQRGSQNPDFYLLMAPVWGGLKSKNQFLPMAEVFWEMDWALYYEKAYLIQSSVGSQENLDWGGILGAGFDVWWTRWLLSGVEAKLHMVVDGQRFYPFMQIGLRLGIKG